MSVEIAGTELRIDGEPRVLLCASLFAFRVPREQWRDRLEAVARLGYHAIDVYVPWNFHETEPGQWDFTGQRDIDRFLELARDVGLLVVARPGPYICSEWDGGGLPAWLPLRDGLRLRQNEPLYLAEVETWFARIMPILARHQHTRGGPVVLVQVENELDFFDCDDPAGYIGALADSARRHGIDVPLIACAGQGDIARATGEVPDVVAAVNLYPDDDSTDIEQHASYFENALRKQDLPLLVMETNRLHRTLKRLLVCGTRLLGPYLQASGWNTEFGTAVNNWGDLLGFMTHDYDFGGVLDPAGAERADAAEARRLAGLINALGPRLAAAIPAGNHALDLAGGGQLVSLTNLTSTGRGTEFGGLAVIVPPETCLLLLRDMPFTGVPSRLIASGAELVGLVDRPGEVVATFASRGDATVLLHLDGEWSAHIDGDVRVGDDGHVRVTGSIGSASLTTASGTIKVVFEPAEMPPAPPSAAPPHEVTKVHLSTRSVTWRTIARKTSALPLERFGIYRGAGRYDTTVDLRGVSGLVLRAAADIIDVRVDDKSMGWIANGGADLWVPLKESFLDPDTHLGVIARIWGHSNFDDGRLPSLRLGSLRGIAGVLAVTDIIDVSTGWLVDSAGLPEVGTAPPPRGGVGGWMSGRFPQTIRYRRGIERSGPAAMRVVDGQARLDIALNGAPIGTITPLTPVLWLGELQCGDELTVEVHRAWGEPVGGLNLLRGHLIDGWDVARQTTHETTDAELIPGELPLTVPAGQTRWVRVRTEDLRTTDPNTVFRFEGNGLLVTARANGQNLGRVWIDAPPPGATLRGGRGDLFIIPSSWLHSGLDLLVEATGSTAGQLNKIVVGGPVDIPREGANL